MTDANTLLATELIPSEKATRESHPRANDQNPVILVSINFKSIEKPGQVPIVCETA